MPTISRSPTVPLEARSRNVERLSVELDLSDPGENREFTRLS